MADLVSDMEPIDVSIRPLKGGYSSASHFLVAVLFVVYRLITAQIERYTIVRHPLGSQASPGANEAKCSPRHDEKCPGFWNWNGRDVSDQVTTANLTNERSGAGA